MGLLNLFEKREKEIATPMIFIPENEAEAFVAILFSFMIVDGEISDAEREILTKHFITTVRFKDQVFVNSYKKVIKAVVDGIPLNDIIDFSCPFILPEYKETVFAIVLDIISIGIVTPEEEALLLKFAERLQVDEATAVNIIKVTAIRNKGREVVL